MSNLNQPEWPIVLNHRGWNVPNRTNPNRRLSKCGTIRNLRNALLRNQQGLCYYCHRALREKGCTLDHKQPLSLGGTNERSNLAAACVYCNNGKGNMTEQEFRAYVVCRGLRIKA